MLTHQLKTESLLRGHGSVVPADTTINFVSCSLFKADKLERELQQARELGRWLSDDERSAIENHEQQKLELIEQQRHNRSRLIVFTVVCLLVPPLYRDWQSG